MSLPPPPPAPWTMRIVDDEPATAAAEPARPPDDAPVIHPTDQLADRSFSAFYEQSWDQVARGLAATLGDRALAAEATDEAMVRAYERWSAVRGYQFPAGWVYRVALNWARSYHRRLARALPVRRDEPAELPPIAEPSIRSALLDLPVKLRSVVVCRLLLDWSVDETADALRIPPGTVKSRLSRAVSILESTLGHLR